MSEDEALIRRAAREARRATRAARTSRAGDGDGMPRPVEAAREAVTAAAVGAAVGAMRALAAQQREERGEPEDERVPEPQPDVADRQDAEQPEAEREPEPREERRPPPVERRDGAGPGDVERAVRAAREQLRALHGKEAESVSSFGRTREGWRVTLEVLELQRIPQTTDVLGSYLVELDRNGNLVAYERLRRYHRSEADDG